MPRGLPPCKGNPFPERKYYILCDDRIVKALKPCHIRYPSVLAMLILRPSVDDPYPVA